MAVAEAMFLFEVVIDSVKSLVESRQLVIRGEFADIFSLELKDPKQMNIIIPEPPPLPPEPAGKKGKKAKKPPKPKKGKKGAVEELPPEPCIQSGQSVLFTSSAEVLIENMKKFPLEVSLWSKEDNLVYIGMTCIPWDQIFLIYLEKIVNCEEPSPVTLKEEYNVFEEGTAKLMAKLGMQIKLSYLSDKVTTCFRTLSEDPSVKKYLYTGINSKTTSYICTMKTTDEDFEENCNKIENNYVKDKPKSNKIVYADFKNAPSTNLTFFNEGDYCCMGNADKPPESIYKSPHTLPDIDFIVDYVRKVIMSCNDNLRMLTPRPTIKPRAKATDIDRLCYCKETSWPSGKLAERFKKEALSEPCPQCINAGKRPEGPRGLTYDLANIRGPCGRAECRVARDIRAYIENLVEEDQKEININDIVGPCGSKECTLAEKIQEFLRHEGIFSQGVTSKGLSTQCACVEQMRDALQKKKSCKSVCSKECDNSDSEASRCEGLDCPFNKNQQVYNVFYFTVELDSPSPTSSRSPTHSSPKTTPMSSSAAMTGSEPSKYQFCPKECPFLKTSEETVTCSKSVCSTITDKRKTQAADSKCQSPVCPNKDELAPSPADSDIVIQFDNIHNPCCVKSCDIAEKVKDLIVEGVRSKGNKTTEEDPCYCDCVCNFKFTKRTTYCAVCGGYECLGDDMQNQPEYIKPQPCPVYHKLYDKHFIKVTSPWPEGDDKKAGDPRGDNVSMKSSRGTGSNRKLVQGLSSTRSIKMSSEKKSEPKVNKSKPQKEKKENKKIGKFTANVVNEVLPVVEKKPETKYPYPPVPKNMGWLWTAEDIPGMKPRPKWRPGAVNKILVRRYRAIREGVDTIAKKKRAMLQRKKKVEMKPTLVVKKQDGEYTVQMEVFKKYSKERLVFQYPYDDKSPLIYSVGKTEEEKNKIQKHRERKERRETRRKSRLLQSTFRDKCQEICLKAYNQAIGLLPLPNPNDPECPCHTVDQNISPPIDSCSCSDADSVSSSETDGDDWIIEFSPPAAKWDPKAKHPPVLVENESQYTYLDYKVKLFDKQGNPVPRFFKGPDGKQECSDLGGFWSPDHKNWFDINKDGYIGVDNRWVPMNFTGPDGMFYSAEEGSFTDNTGQLLKIGIDGYIDKDCKWVWYSKRPKKTVSKSSATVNTKVIKSEKQEKSKADNVNKQNKGKQTKLEAKAGETLSRGKSGNRKDKITKSVSYTTGRAKSPVVMNLSVDYEKNMSPRSGGTSPKYNVIDPRKIAKYHEIMQDLEMYEDLGKIRPPVKTNRASNTPKNISSSYRNPKSYRGMYTQPLTAVRSLADRSIYSFQLDSPSVR